LIELRENQASFRSATINGCQPSEICSTSDEGLNGSMETFMFDPDSDGADDSADPPP
jgi:hypothetical protein